MKAALRRFLARLGWRRIRAVPDRHTFEFVTYKGIGHDFTFQPMDPEGLTARGVMWTSREPRVGDLMIFRHRGHPRDTASYRITSVTPAHRPADMYSWTAVHHERTWREKVDDDRRLGLMSGADHATMLELIREHEAAGA